MRITCIDNIIVFKGVFNSANIFPLSFQWIFNTKKVSRTKVKRAVEFIPSPSPTHDPKNKVVLILRCIVFEKPRSGFSNV